MHDGRAVKRPISDVEGERLAFTYGNYAVADIPANNLKVGMRESVSPSRAAIVDIGALAHQSTVVDRDVRAANDLSKKTTGARSCPHAGHTAPPDPAGAMIVDWDIELIRRELP